MKFLKVAFKDLKIEFRTKNTVNFMFLFALLSIMLFSATMENPDPAILWLVFIFAGMLGYSRAFLKEVETGTLEALKISPLPPTSILFGKIVFNGVLMLMIQALLIPIFIAVFSIYPKNLFLAVVSITLGNLAFVVISSSLSLLVIKSKARELLLPVLLFPVLFPVVLSTVQAFTMAVNGNVEGISAPLSVIIAFTMAMIGVGYLTVDYALVE
ncbi:heme exporter protein CcmB [Geoglobus acetivorans]|uniref:Heme exporter protein CcmB n=1 Tax=Geoglobus acetivorans TaxID=565033 RepID=A0ABZ3H3Y9_GEOAI|nr:heme exporter protein CcmB [Geoglobus acetivorans]